MNEDDIYDKLRPLLTELEKLYFWQSELTGPGMHLLKRAYDLGSQDRYVEMTTKKSPGTDDDCVPSR